MGAVEKKEKKEKKVKPPMCDSRGFREGCTFTATPLLYWRQACCTASGRIERVHVCICGIIKKTQAQHTQTDWPVSRVCPPFLSSVLLCPYVWIALVRILPSKCLCERVFLCTSQRPSQRVRIPSERNTLVAPVAKQLQVIPYSNTSPS